MKFNKKSLVRLAILSSILGLNGFCDVANAMNDEKICHSMDVKGKNVVSNDNVVEEEEKPRYHCVICLRDVNKDQAILPCGDVFHYGCLDKWRNYYKECPICTRVTSEDEINKVKEAKCAMCGDSSTVFDLILTSGKFICGGCMLGSLKIDFEAQDNDKREQQPIHYTCPKDIIKKLDMTTTDALNIQNILRKDGGQFVLELDDFRPIPKNPENQKDDGNDSLLQKMKEGLPQRDQAPTPVAKLNGFDSNEKYIRALKDNNIPWDGTSLAELNGFDSNEKYNEALIENNIPLDTTSGRETIKNQEAYDAYEKAVFNTNWDDNMKENAAAEAFYAQATN